LRSLGRKARALRYRPSQDHHHRRASAGL